jgi:hypothetical protein
VIADYPIIPLYKQIANPRYYTGENTIGSPAPSDSYTSFASFDILDPSTYYRYSTSQTVVDSKTDIEGYPSNDIAIINCNFGTNPPASAKSKLDVLNNY